MPGPGRLLLKTLSAVPVFGLATLPTAAMTLLPWTLSQFPDGGIDMAVAVAEPLVTQSDLLMPSCQALAPGSIRQVASGFTGIGIAVATSQPAVSEELSAQLPLCCPILIGTDVDRKITFGTAVALEVRSLAERDIDSARKAGSLLGVCEDETVQRSYEIARGEDTLGQLIAQEGEEPAIPIGSNTPPVVSGGGIPSTN